MGQRSSASGGPRPLAGPDVAILSRHRGVCRRCSDPIERGEMIVRVPRGWAHEWCGEQAARQPEGGEQKALRYIAERRLDVTAVAADRVRASCRGGGGVYALGHDDRGWWCDCPARSTCSHLRALQLVTVRGQR